MKPWPPRPQPSYTIALPWGSTFGAFLCQLHQVFIAFFNNLKKNPGASRRIFDSKFHENGKLSVTTTWSNDKKNGQQKTYHENGKIASIDNYINDVQVGESKLFYESGKLGRIRRYINGLVEGEYKEFYENGIIEKSGYYLHNQPHGEWKFYNERGKIFQIQVVRNGNTINTKNFK